MSKDFFLLNFRSSLGCSPCLSRAFPVLIKKKKQKKKTRFLHKDSYIRGFLCQVRHFESGQGPGDEVANYVA